MMEELADKLKELLKIKSVKPPDKKPQGPIILPPHIKALVKNGRYAISRIGEYNGYDCPNCNGSGIIVYKKILSGPYESTNGLNDWSVINGDVYEIEWMKTFNCPVCNGSTAGLRDNIGLVGDEQKLSYSDLNPAKGQEQVYKAGESILDFYKGNGYIYGWLTVWGDNGRGKSRFAKCLVGEMALRGATVRYMLASTFLMELKDTFGDYSVKTQDILDKYASVDLLVFDELDKVPITEYNQEQLMLFLDGRYRLGVESKKYMTILVMNGSPEDVARKYHVMDIIWLPGCGAVRRCALAARTSGNWKGRNTTWQCLER
jgi:hypothetical protein